MSGKFNSLNANENLQDKWQDLSNNLNSLATDGKKKDVKSWKTVGIYNNNIHMSAVRKALSIYCAQNHL